MILSRKSIDDTDTDTSKVSPILSLSLAILSPILLKYRYRYRRYFSKKVSQTVSPILFTAIFSDTAIPILYFNTDSFFVTSLISFCTWFDDIIITLVYMTVFDPNIKIFALGLLVVVLAVVAERTNFA